MFHIVYLSIGLAFYILIVSDANAKASGPKWRKIQLITWAVMSLLWPISLVLTFWDIKDPSLIDDIFYKIETILTKNEKEDNSNENHSR